MSGNGNNPEVGAGSGMQRVGAILAWLPMLLLVLAAGANAASITATPQASQINVGERVSVEIRLQLEPGESASAFQATFAASGPGLVSIDPNGFGDTWFSPLGFPVLGTGEAATATVSLTADGNRSDHDLLATISVVGTSIGLIALELDATRDLLLQRDFGSTLEDIALDQGPGSMLAQIEVVPEPSTGLLIGLGISGLAWRRRESGTARPRTP